MMARLSSVVVIATAILALVLTGEAVGEDSWQTVTGPDGSFTVEMPVVPTDNPTEMKTGSGESYTMHQYVTELGDVAYVAQTAVYPQSVDTSNPKTNLQAGLANAETQMDGGKWTTVNWVEQQGLVAVDAGAMRGGSAVRSFSVIKGQQIFSLTYVGPAGTGASADATRFIASLKLK